MASLRLFCFPGKIFFGFATAGQNFIKEMPPVGGESERRTKASVLRPENWPPANFYDYNAAVGGRK